jgi:hypothetical protein
MGFEMEILSIRIVLLFSFVLIVFFLVFAFAIIKEFSGQGYSLKKRKKII